MIDQSINAKISLIQTANLNEIMIFITNMGDKVTIAILSFFVIAILIKNKEFVKTKIFVLAISLGVILTTILKYVIQRPRPIEMLILEEGYSFPSGHTTLATIFFGMLIYLFAKEIKNKTIKILFVSLNATLILLISFSRIYLNVHYPTDIIGGITLGLICIIVAVILKEKNSYLKKNSLFQ